MRRPIIIALASVLAAALGATQASAGGWRDEPYGYNPPAPVYDYYSPPPAYYAQPAYRNSEPRTRYYYAPPPPVRYYRSCDFVYDNYNGYTPCRRW
jgi:hypothetical protein